MKNHKQYILRGLDSDEAVAVIGIPAQFHMKNLLGTEGRVDKLTSQTRSNYASIIYNFQSKSGSTRTINDVGRLDLVIVLKEDHYELLQPLAIEEITESYSETVKDFGLPQYKITQSEYSSGTHTLDAVRIPNPHIPIHRFSWKKLFRARS